MYQKAEHSNSGSVRCCFCFHVRTGTILLGIWNLVIHILQLTLLFSIFVHPEVHNQISGWTTSRRTSHASVSDYYSPKLPDSSDGATTNYAFNRNMWQPQEIHVTFAVTICTCVITLFLLYGAIRGQAKYLMPFFIAQVFDFTISVLTAVGYFSYIPDVRRMFEETTDMPFQKELLHLDPKWLCTILMVTVAFCMMLKAYFMVVVWSCYNYLKYLQVAHIVDTYAEADSEALLPPDYEAATKMPPHGALYAPPPYTANCNGV